MTDSNPELFSTALTNVDKPMPTCTASPRTLHSPASRNPVFIDSWSSPITGLMSTSTISQVRVRL